jgi:DNA polymerase III epsilon subunit-like protein
MANFHKICVFDLETDGTDPKTCSPIQIAAVMVDPVSLRVIPDSQFNVNLKPEKLQENPNYLYDDSDVLDFHAKVRGCSRQEVLDSWHQYHNQEQGWQAFVSYLEMYHMRGDSKKSCFTAPIAAGYNIHRFDLRIIDRLSLKYNNVNKENNSSLFFPRDVLDLMNTIFYWFEGNNELKNYTLDHLREYFGLSAAGAHDAIKDVSDTAELVIRFLKLHRKLSNKVKFKGSFLNA